MKLFFALFFSIVTIALSSQSYSAEKALYSCSFDNTQNEEEGVRVYSDDARLYTGGESSVLTFNSSRYGETLPAKTTYNYSGVERITGEPVAFSITVPEESGFHVGITAMIQIGSDIKSLTCSKL